jgi:hypothetical protein
LPSHVSPALSQKPAEAFGEKRITHYLPHFLRAKQNKMGKERHFAALLVQSIGKTGGVYTVHKFCKSARMIEKESSSPRA